MRRTRQYMSLLVLASLMLAVGLAQVSDAEEAVEHLEVDADVPCDVCHAEMTPKLYKSWYAGRHGKNNVKCFVCHGSIGSDFTKKPENFRCVGCHADQVATAGETSCFACHPPHPLTPHLMPTKAPEGGEK